MGGGGRFEGNGVLGKLADDASQAEAGRIDWGEKMSNWACGR